MVYNLKSHSICIGSFGEFVKVPMGTVSPYNCCVSERQLTEETLQHNYSSPYRATTIYLKDEYKPSLSH